MPSPESKLKLNFGNQKEIFQLFLALQIKTIFKNLFCMHWGCNYQDLNLFILEQDHVFGMW